MRGFVLEDFPQSPMEAGQSPDPMLSSPHGYLSLASPRGASRHSQCAPHACAHLFAAALSTAALQPQKVLVVHFALPHAVRFSMDLCGYSPSLIPSPNLNQQTRSIGARSEMEVADDR